MGKFALLIGVSQYEIGLNPLPGTLKDVEAMQRVLLHPDMGDFAEKDVKVLKNPQKLAMEEAIEWLFSKRHKDDLLLLYFSGHGIDENFKLYLTNSQTAQDDQGNIIIARTIPANWIHDRMESSRSQQQVIILDCCFSGAFAKGMVAKGGNNSTVDIKLLRGEGRAVLTSSTGEQRSFAEGGEELSVYTRYIVEGIETGAADIDNDGIISVDELHEFARMKVQEALPAMKPTIYVMKEGFKIYLAKAPVGNPKLEYRKEVEKCLHEGKISIIGKRILKRRQSELNLSDNEIKQIENEVLEPYQNQKYQTNLQEYEKVLKEALDDEETLSEHTREELKRFQQILQLRDEDIAPIEARFNRSLIPVQPISIPAIPSPTVQPIQPSTIPSQTQKKINPNKDLSSEVGIDYRILRDLLAAGDWEEADNETYLVMIEAVGKKDGDWFTKDDILNFPCTDLQTIDRLWVRYSNNKFGFSVQKEIYLSVGGKPDGKYYQEAWEKYCIKVAWKTTGYSYINHTQINFNTSALRGHLPYPRPFRLPYPNISALLHSCENFIYPVSLFSRLEICRLMSIQVTGNQGYSRSVPVRVASPKEKDSPD